MSAFVRCRPLSIVEVLLLALVSSYVGAANGTGSSVASRRLSPEVVLGAPSVSSAAGGTIVASGIVVTWACFDAKGKSVSLISV